MSTPVKGSHVEGFNAPVVNRNLAKVRTARSRLSNENMAKAGYNNTQKNLEEAKMLFDPLTGVVPAGWKQAKRVPMKPTPESEATFKELMAKMPKIPNGMTLNEYLKTQKGAKRRGSITRKRKHNKKRTRRTRH